MSQPARERDLDRDDDLRVLAVLDVLTGSPLVQVARQHEVDVALLHRWVRAFVDAGSAAVTNRPVEDTARQRDRFLAVIAHELRTPLATAIGWSALLGDDDVSAQEVREYAGGIDRALETLDDRVRHLELLATASLGRVKLKPARVAVTDLGAGLTGRPGVRGAGPHDEVTVDPKLFARVLNDLWLAGHAGKTPREVTLELRRLESWDELRVVRQGSPLSPRTLQALFEPFEYNLDTMAITTGLYLARALTVAHGGTLGVEQDGEETAFWVRVPASPGPIPIKESS